MKISARRLLVGFFLFFLAFSLFKYSVYAQNPQTTSTPTPTPISTTLAPGEPDWRVDAEVTQVGKNAERARELIYWVVKHPLIVKVPVIAKIWAMVRNVAYALSLLVIIGLALHLIIAVRNIGPTFSGISLGLERMTLFRILVRIAAILLFITFSYILMRLVIEGAEVLGRFFIEYLGGEDLFNIVFSGGNLEQNYTHFVGYRNFDPLEMEMASTSLFLVRLTSFTYNFMSVILILRQVILIFLLIVSPILAIILPFIFIRNTGWVWIGEFFRWLFYGPLFALFISALAQIWKAGIPFAFDFTRAKTGIMIYPTAVNILYGGPAQVLTATNTSNYIDTYAEYVIGLIMLWAAIVLPWLLLKIFRDYCCDILKENQNALMQILDKVRNFSLPPTPPLKPAPATSTGMTFNLPFRRPVYDSKLYEKESVIERINERNIENIRTQDLLKAVNLDVRTLRDIAHTETNRSVYSNIQNVLNKINNPASVSSISERNSYTHLKETLTKRAQQGDTTAINALRALSPKVSETPHLVSNLPSEVLREAVARPGMPVIVPQVQRVGTVSLPSIVSPALLQQVAQKTQVPQEKVEAVLKHLPTVTGTVEEQKEKLAEKAQITKEQVSDVLNNLPTEQIVSHVQTISAPPIITSGLLAQISQQTQIPPEKIEAVLRHLPTVTGTVEQRTEKLAQETQTTKEEVTNILSSLPKEQAIPQAAPTVTIEEYEEIKSMWLNHYRESEIPMTDKIQSRQQWLEEDVKKLSNTINLLTSVSIKDRQKGMEEVANLLPFLLLGGFGDLETITYLKAKLEAAKLVIGEMDQVEKAKEQMKKEEEKVEIPAEEKKEEEKQMEAEEALEQKLPEEKPEEKLASFMDATLSENQINNNQPIPANPTNLTNSTNNTNLPDQNKV